MKRATVDVKKESRRGGPMRKRGRSGWLKNAAGRFVVAADGWHRLEDFPPQGERPAVAQPGPCQPFYWGEKQQLFKKTM